jgi:hypothetical protein
VSQDQVGIRRSRCEFTKLKAVSMVQRLHEIFLKIRTQLMYALHPCTADFQLFRPESTYTADNVGAFPWTLRQLDGVLSAHTSVMASYLQSLSPEALSICCSMEVRAALVPGATSGVLPGDDLDTEMAALLLRTSLCLREACQEMLLESAEAFASHLQTYCSSGGSPVVEPSVANVGLPFKTALLCCCKPRAPGIRACYILQILVKSHSEEPMWEQECWESPLLKVDLDFSDGHVVCSPPLDALQQAVLARLDDMAQTLTEVQDDCLGAVQGVVVAPRLTADGWRSDTRFCRSRYECTPPFHVLVYPCHEVSMRCEQ